VLRLVGQLPKTQTSRAIADQLLRSGTSVGANVHEARSAESRADFVHKMQIALKEARETSYWLILTAEAKLAETPTLPDLVEECDQITAILVASVKTARRNAEVQGQRIGI
jgi:four helix bundle protein